MATPNGVAFILRGIRTSHLRSPVFDIVVSSADTMDVYLRPQSFLTDMGISFHEGDEIALTGSKVKHEGADPILPREVSRWEKISKRFLFCN